MNKQNIPKLRFPEFKGEWEKKKLGEIAERVTIRNNSNDVKNVFTNSAVHGIVNQRDFFDKDIANQNNLLNYYVVEKNDFIYNPRISNNAPVGPICRNHIGQGVMSPLYSVFKFIDGNLDFLETYFSTTLWYEYLESIANYGARFDRMNITIKDFYEMPLSFPSLSEQTRIASFFTVIDKKLSQLKQKKNLLEEYKKGLMQKLFSQELRFKIRNEDGELVEPPKWEKKKLGEVATKITTGKLDANAMVENGEYRFYTCAKDFFQIDKYAFDTEALLISGNGANVGYIHYYKGKFNAYQRTYVLDGFNDNIIYVKYYLDKFLYERINTEKKEGNTPYIVLSTLSEMEILVPTIEEQTKIANFLTAIDKKIMHCEKQIEQTEIWKKGLLQKMFC